MWSHYANNHTGFCVGFDEKMMKYSSLFDKGAMVDYINEYPEINQN